MNKKILLVFLVVALLIVGLLWMRKDSNNKPEVPTPGNEAGTEVALPSGENTNVSETTQPSGDEIHINQIDDLASAKLLVESKEITREELPSDIRHLADVYTPGNMKLSSISAYYTKSNQSTEAFDILHDYVLLFFDDVEGGSIKISASKEGNPLRDYFFSTTNEMSRIKGTDVKISQFSDKYIINFSQGRFNFDIETNGLKEYEMVNLVNTAMK